MEVYGATGYAKTIEAIHLDVRKRGEKEPKTIAAERLQPPYDDPLHLLAAVIRGDVQEDDDLSGLKINVTASMILDAARRSAQSGKTISFPIYDPLTHAQ
jgi:hypothetical protein